MSEARKESGWAVITPDGRFHAFRPLLAAVLRATVGSPNWQSRWARYEQQGWRVHRADLTIHLDDLTFKSVEQHIEP